MWLFKSKEEKQAIGDARAEYGAFAHAASSAAPEQAKSLAAAFRSNQRLAALDDEERRDRARDAFRLYAENVLADDALNVDEESAFGEVAAALGIGQTALQEEHPDILGRLMVAKLNEGRLTVIEAPQMLTKKNEVVHLEIGAALLKEVALREWQAGSRGVSFRIAKGVSYRVGNTRGKSVVVGTEQLVEDAGMLSVTSSRVVFTGERKSMEIPFSKLLDLKVFPDAIVFHASNRQRSPMFRIQMNMADVVAATVNAAVQGEDGQTDSPSPS
jgi:hypothetical protein